jgi:hypothetical protein
MKALLIITASVVFLSCNKEKQEDINQFYGKWKASYNDTIEFFRSGNINIVRYDKSMSPSVPDPPDNEYTFKNNKLGIKNGLNGPDQFYFLDSFKWIEKGKKFEVQGIDWFLFLSSTQVYFTFTKIE